MPPCVPAFCCIWSGGWYLITPAPLSSQREGYTLCMFPYINGGSQLLNVFLDTAISSCASQTVIAAFIQLKKKKKRNSNTHAKLSQNKGYHDGSWVKWVLLVCLIQTGGGSVKAAACMFHFTAGCRGAALHLRQWQTGFVRVLAPQPSFALLVDRCQTSKRLYVHCCIGEF